MIPSDLKDFRAADYDGFQMISDEAAGWALAAALFVCWLFDRMGWLS
jgi:hypothetical protein